MDDSKYSVIAEAFDESESEIPNVQHIKCEYDYAGESNDQEFNYLDTPEASLEDGDLSREDSSQPATESGPLNSFASTVLSGIFWCSRCDFSCTSTKDLVAHYQRYREKEPFKCFQCGYDGKDRQDFVDHSHSHLEKTYFKCTKCRFRTNSKAAIKEHIQGKHARGSKAEMYKCPLCSRSLASKWNLKLHLGRCKGLQKNGIDGTEGHQKQQQQLIEETQIEKREEPENNPFFTCPYCYFIFGSKLRRTRHINSVHFKRKKRPPQGEEEVKKRAKNSTTQLIEEHEVAVPDVNPSVKLERIYLCPICHYVFTSASSLSKHIVSHNMVTECPVCKFECETSEQLREHVATHSSAESKHPCTICDEKFPTLGKLKYHIKDEHSKKFKCPLCPRIIKTENAHKLHMEAHSKVMKEYYCPKCKFTARNSSLLQYHMSRFHPTKKRFVCENCTKSYKYKYSLQRHEANCPGKDLKAVLVGSKSREEGAYSPEIEIDISQKEKLSCSECKASFREAEHLKKHLLVHFHMMPFRCLKCGFRCKTKHMLTQHMKIHNIKSNYECRVCGKKFKHRHALNNHSIIHSDERPYTCEVCSLTFKRKANYRRHYDIHSDVKPFKCPHCYFTTRRKDGLQKHIISHIKPLT